MTIRGPSTFTELGAGMIPGTMLHDQRKKKPKKKPKPRKRPVGRKR